MTLFGLDISNYQPDFMVDLARAEGYDFLTHKMTEGTWIDPYFARVYQQARTSFAGRFGGYCFVRVDTPPDAEADAIERCARDAGARVGDFPIQIDYEDDHNDGSVEDLTARVETLLARGWKLLPIYLPRWYHRDHMGAPDLSHLPVGLWNSNYITGSGPALTLYPGDDHPGWNGFGGRPVQLLQFSDRGFAAGRTPVDLNAFRGTATELDALFAGGTSMANDVPQAILEQEAGPGASPTNYPGWPAWLYHLAPDKQPLLTQTNFLRAIHQKVASLLPARGDKPNPRPKSLDTPDDHFGHTLSLRAQVDQTQQMLVEVARALPAGDTLVAKLEEIRGGRA